MLRITLKKSVVGHNWRNRLTIKSLGLHRIRQTVEHEDTPNIRGMIKPVKDLLIVENVEGEPGSRLNIAKRAKSARQPIVVQAADPRDAEPEPEAPKPVRQKKEKVEKAASKTKTESKE